MHRQIVAGMRRQLSLIEQALNRPLNDDDEIHELQSGLFYINPDEIVRIDDEGAEKVSFFTLEPEIQHDIFLNYAKE